MRPVHGFFQIHRWPLSLRILTAFLLLILTIWGISLFYQKGFDGGLAEFERTLMLALREADDPSQPRGPPWLQRTAIDWTALGGVPVTALLVTLACGYLWVMQRRRTACFLLISTAGGVALSFYLKTLYDRARPDFLDHLATTATSSFPSSHAMASAVVYLTLGTLLARATHSRKAKIYCVGTAVFLTLAIGLTRVYLGVHYPTDVLAGWVFGGLWSLGCLTLMIRLQRKGVLRIEGTDARP